MKVTFPHMGNQYVGTKVLLEEVGLDVIVPVDCSKETLNIGTKYSPESICLPLKINIGNFVESINEGANTIVMIGSCGPCRFGYYSILQNEILKEMGHEDVEIILLDAPQGNFKGLLDSIYKLTKTKNPYKIINALVKATRVLYQIDDLEDLMYYKRPRQKNIGEADLYYDELHKKIRGVRGYREVSRLIKETKEKILRIEEDPGREVLRVGLIGEIYTILEPSVNVYIEKKLGEMGVEIEKSLRLSHWITEHLFLNPLNITMDSKIRKEAKPYLKTMIGGHARETIGYGIHYAKRGFDGLIQVYPFTCMPEIVAQSIMPQVEKEYDIPYLCLIVDEMTGEAGFNTRLEAFVDLLGKRKEMKVS
ncbi:CoA protein activase [Serpentinicella alkaliphila]|uniref:Putative nucleotide-binding protein (Sugar kinase/HSP70/actin superfamily) n=1 Tax=Serpentinicella alkaliphila TaxID=1734049 RepID=A0A4R2TM99_9FIRM|nr:CoA protein activase [Serpentinicella alkaliphila]QUH24708.1 CoA protein activase [Serpentinicella alkaliphila]TCQ03697.1 putative nucleotide-binding protein (sugar kinase/HSP70/actin superfamily) [Serpentinicella alkaliphila]